MDNGTIDLTEVRKYIVDLVPKAGEILRKHFLSGGYTQKQKEGVDFTTQADEETDVFLRENISRKYPQTQFLTEETAPEDYSSLKDAENLWVIDPLDGTTNFSRRNPHFAISIALVDKARSKLGVVYVPMAGDFYWVQEDQEGAFLNEKPISVSNTSQLREAVIAADWAHALEKRKYVVRWIDTLSTSVRQIKMMGSAVTDLATLARGGIDAYIHSGLKPWDVAASTLFVEKAGGRITTPKGESWDVFNPEMLASNGVLHEKILDLVNERSSR